MRLLSVAAPITGLLITGLLLTAALPAGDGKKKDKDKDKDKSTTITEVGGKSMEVWIKDISHKDPGRRATAISMVLLFGPERAYQALPAIIDQFNKSSVLDVSVRVNGATALGLIIGSAADPETKHVREAVRILQRLLLDGQAIVKYRAVQALGRIGKDANEAIPNVLPLLSKDNLTCETRQAAAVTLGQIAVVDKEKGPPLNVQKALFQCLGDPASQVRLAAIQSLTWLGAPADPKAKDTLIATLTPVAAKDPEPNVQIWAHMAIMSINRDVEAPRVGMIIGCMSHPEVAVRLQAAQALGTIGVKGKAAVPALHSGLEDKDHSVILMCIWALSRMEGNASGAVPRLEKLSTDPDMPEQIKEAALEAIKQIKKAK